MAKDVIMREIFQKRSDEVAVVSAKRTQRRRADPAMQASHQFGDVAGDNGALAGAIRIWKLALADTSRVDNAADWAATLNGLGAALHTLGGRESGTAPQSMRSVHISRIMQQN
jgi:hypothetical protein